MAAFNRNTSEGSIVSLKKDGVEIGSIGTVSSDLAIYSTNSGHKGLRFGNGSITPTTNAGAIDNGNTDLGGNTIRFKDLYLSGTANVGGSSVIAADGASDNSYVMNIKNQEATDGRSYGVNIEAGSNATDSAVLIKTHDANNTLFRIHGNGQATFVDGTASLPSITNTGDLNTGIFFPAADTIGLATGGVERARIDSLGNFTFTVNTNETLKITTSTTNPTATSPHILLRDSAGTYEKNFRNNSGASSHYKFYNPNGEVGQITTSGSATAYNTSSDYRLKENVDYTWDATTRLKQLKPARFNFIADDTNTFVDGFLAHEVSSVVPEAITGAKDAMMDEEYEVTPAVEEVRDADDNITTEAVDAVMGTRSVPDYQGIDQSKLVPLLIKTIQELEARITTLEG